MEKSRHFKLFIKHLLDKVFALIALVIISPIFIVIGIILKLQGEDIFFLQKRTGYLGNEIGVYKFTTMPKGSEKLGLITIPNDPRTTNIGKLLRKTSLNEIPQLLNILKGDMSFVGPRPLVQIGEYLNIDEIIKYYRMRPGITGISSLHYYDEDKLLQTQDDPYKYYKEVISINKQKYEEEYYKNWSIMLDYKIILLTLKKVIYDRYR